MSFVVVVGAGVIGLSVALHLQEEGFDVRIIAEHTPSDIPSKPIEYCSMWAGAHHVSHANMLKEKEQFLLDKETLVWMKKQKAKDPAFPVMNHKQVDLFEVHPGPGDLPDVAKEMGLENLQLLEAQQLPPGAVEGISFETLAIDPIPYLNYLYDVFKKNGGTTTKRKLQRVSSAIDEFEPPLAVFNCTGLGALELLQDDKMHPVRGQLVLIKAVRSSSHPCTLFNERQPWVKSGLAWHVANAAATYIVPRPSGIVILGGTREMDDWEANPRDDTTQRICQSCIKLMPELLPPDKREANNWKDLDIVDVTVGRRPMREGGVKIHAELATTRHGVSTILVHCYGHAGGGFQSSRGSATAAVRHFKRALRVWEQLKAQESRSTPQAAVHPCDR